MKQSGNYSTGLTLSGLPNLKQLLVLPGKGFTDKSNSKSTQVFYCTVYVYMADSTPLQRTVLFHFKSLAKSFRPLWLFAHFPPVAIVGNINMPWGGEIEEGQIKSKTTHDDAVVYVPSHTVDYGSGLGRGKVIGWPRRNRKWGVG